jgi:hypothetical protein
MQLNNDYLGELPSNNLPQSEVIRTLNEMIQMLNKLNQTSRAGVITPLSQADTDASNNTIYYSTTATKLVYKDSGGTVHALY